MSRVITLYARYADPRAGVAEHRVTSLRRVDPPPELFDMPSDYTSTTVNMNQTLSFGTWTAHLGGGF